MKPAISILICATIGVVCADRSAPAATSAETSSTVQWMRNDQQPAEATSPSGRYSIKVVPSSRDKGGKGLYRFKEQGTKVWEKELPYAFEQVWIGDEGRFCGYAYSAGFQGWGARSDPNSSGDLVFAIVDRTGQVVTEKRVKRFPSHYPDSSPYPGVWSASCVFFGADVLLMGDTSGEEHGEKQTWRLNLTAGTIGLVKTPRVESAEVTNQHLVSATKIPGTPYGVYEWYEVAKGGGYGVRFVVGDVNGEAVSNVDWPDDYTSTLRGSGPKEDEIFNHGSFFDLGTGFIAFRSFKSDTTVEFKIEDGKLRETSRRPHVATAPRAKDAVDWTRPSSRTLKVEATVTPKDSENAGEAWGGELMAGPSGTLIRLEDSTEFVRLVQYDVSGKILHRIELAGPTEPDRRSAHACLASGTKFAVAVSERDPTKTTLFLVDLLTEKKTVFATLPDRMADKIAFGSDRVFVLGDRPMKYSSAETLTAVDTTGKQVWEIYQDGFRNVPGELSSPMDLDVAGNEVVVLQNGNAAVSFYNVKDGKFSREISLERTWKRKPEYVTSLERYGAGWILSETEDNFVIVDGKFNETGRLRPHYSDGKTFNVFDGPVKASDGSYWVLAGRSVCKIDAKFQVTKSFGQQRRKGALTDPGQVITNGLDTIYVGDSPTGSVFAFNAKGKLVRSFLVEAGDFKSTNPDARISLSNTGHVFITSFDINADIEYGPDGTRLRKIPLVESLKDDDDVPPPETRPPGTRWLGRFDTTYLVDRDRKVIGTVDRRYDEHWLKDPLIQGPGGTLMSAESEATKTVWSFYSNSGRPQSMASLEFPQDSVKGTVYDGTSVYVAFDKGLAAFDKTGKFLWHFPWPKGYKEAPELIGVLSGGRLVVWGDKGIDILIVVEH